MLLTAFYDLAFGPVSYDFVTWLVRAMKERDARQCTRLHVVIVPKDDGLGGFARPWGRHDEAATRWRLWHIVIPACALAGATVTLAPTRRFAEDLCAENDRGAEAITGSVLWWPKGKAHFMGPLVEAARRGEAIQKLRATDQARHYVRAWLSHRASGKPVITFTLRNQTTDPDRNTAIGEWIAFEQWIKNTPGDWHVITVNEVNVSLQLGGGYAEFDIDLRLALYEAAQMNYIGNNGPQELLKFSAAPYRAFGQALTEGWKDHFRKYFGMEPGEQLPWAAPNQRLVYKPDTIDNLIAEFPAA